MTPTLEMQAADAPKHAAMHPDEWQARVQLAACYRIFDLLGWTEMIYNHITLRVPSSASGGERHFLINPFGLHYSEVTASNLVKIDVQGRVLDHSPYPVNPRGSSCMRRFTKTCRRALRDAYAHHGGRRGGVSRGRLAANQLL